MKIGKAKIVRLLLALSLLIAWAGPACAGTDGCTMPCCQNKAKPASSHAAKPCCAPSAPTGCDFASDCLYPSQQALPSASAAPLGADLAGAVTAEFRPALPVNPPAVPPARSGPPFDTPLFLSTLSLRI
jgi:hypothetical protein